MIDILIAEDEESILEGLVKLFEANGFNVIATANNGLDAYEKIKFTRCQLVVTDIKMPIMDGLTLMRKCQELTGFTPPKFVVITGFEKFEYAKEAVNLGAMAFLSKVSIVEDLDNIIASIKQFFYKSEIDKQLLKNKILEHYINFDSQQISDEGDEYRDLSFMSIGIYGASEPFAKYDFNLSSDNFVDFNLHKNLYLLLFFNKRAEEIKTDEYIDAISQKLDFEKHKILVSDVKTSLTGALHTLFDISHMMATTKVFRNKKCLRFHETEISEIILSYETVYAQKQIENRIIHEISNQNYDGLQLSIREWFDFISANYSSFSEMKKHVILLYSIVIWKIEDITSDFSSLNHIKNQIYQLNDSANMIECRAAFLKNLNRLIPVASDMLSNQAATDKTMQQAKIYIEENITEKISLKGAASYCYMSPTYFSTVFKKHFGQTFSTYVNSLKMQRAKQLIKSGLSVTEVAEKLNYSEIKNFRRMFTKLYGMSPSKFIKTGGKQCDT